VLARLHPLAEGDMSRQGGNRGYSNRAKSGTRAAQARVRQAAARGRSARRVLAEPEPPGRRPPTRNAASVRDPVGPEPNGAGRAEDTPPDDGD
jgi:hypothetical protein